MDNKKQQLLAERCVAEILNKDRVVRGLGIELLEVEPGRVALQMRVRDDMLNSLGHCHGGMSFTLADAAFACACTSTNQAGVGAYAAMDYLRPAGLGDLLTARGRVRHLGSSASVVEVVVSNQDDKDVALLHGRSHNFGRQFLENP